MIELVERRGTFCPFFVSLRAYINSRKFSFLDLHTDAVNSRTKNITSKWRFMFLDCLFDPLDYLKQVSFSVRLLNVWTSLLT